MLHHTNSQRSGACVWGRTPLNQDQVFAQARRDDKPTLSVFCHQFFRLLGLLAEQLNRPARRSPQKLMLSLANCPRWARPLSHGSMASATRVRLVARARPAAQLHTAPRRAKMAVYCQAGASVNASASTLMEARALQSEGAPKSSRAVLAGSNRRRG